VKKPRAGWVVVLEPTPDLWTIALSHRTQILYSADISLILLYLEVGPGSIVYESGTGSGSLSYHFINAIAGVKKFQVGLDDSRKPIFEHRRGHLFTFEFNGERAKMAVADFNDKLKVGEFVSVTHRDVVKDGFRNAEFKMKDPESGELVVVEQPKANAVFLDLPMPWEVVKFADEVLVSNGKFCSFSPCIEQVQRTCIALAEHKYTEIVTVEVLTRTYEVRDEFFPIPQLDGDLQSTTAVPVDQTDNEDGSSSSDDENDDEDEEPTASKSKGRGAKSGSTSPPSKKARTDDSDEHKAIKAAEDSSAMDEDSNEKAIKHGKRKRKRARGDGEPGMVVTHPFSTMRGHTGYLTFARKSVPLEEYS
jgi:tRNA A58 N-methylase Trm61